MLDVQSSFVAPVTSKSIFDRAIAWPPLNHTPGDSGTPTKPLAPWTMAPHL